MAEITRFLFWSHLRGESSSFVLQHRGGRRVRGGRGLQFWFLPMTSSLSEVPMDDRDLAILFHARSSDYQDVTVQGVVSWRVADAEKLADRIDFSIDVEKGAWREQPLEKVGQLLTQLAQQLASQHIAQLALQPLLVEGSAEIRRHVLDGLLGESSLAEMGIEIVSVRISDVCPTSEIEKALQMTTREAIQQEADKATFERRAIAVERERAIEENELQNRIELAKREEELIAQRGENERQRVTQEAEASRIAVEARVARSRLEAASEADAIRQVEQARVEAEHKRIDIYRDLPQSVMLGLAAREVASQLPTIEHLSLGPDILGTALTRLADAGAKHLEGV